MRTLILLDTFKDEILPASLQSISAAQKLGNPIDAIAFGKIKDLDKLPVEKVFSCPVVNPTADVAAAAISAIVDSYSHVIAAHTNFGKDVLPRVAGLKDSQPLMDVTAVVSADTFVRPLYAGGINAKIQSSDKIKFISVRPSSFPKLSADGSAKVEDIVAPATGKATVTKVTYDTSDRPKLETASIVVSGGKGLKSRDNFEKLINPLADKLKAAIGASRAAVDSEFAANDTQVGQTGKIVAPDIYIAIGLSGAPQHIAGMQDSKKIFAINLDPEAPIYKIADYGIEADLFDLVPQLTSKLSR